VSTSFLFPASISSVNGDIFFALNSSVISRSSGTDVSLSLTYAEYENLRGQIYSSASLSRLVFSYGSPSKQISLSHYCMFHYSPVCSSIHGLLSDPDPNKCTSECGVLTLVNINMHVACRLQCILPDFTGFSDISFQSSL
jgi:hypothetical protein